MALAINDRIDLPSDTARSSVAIVVGNTDMAGDMVKIFADSDGWLTWHNLPGNIPSATGASHPVILGKVTHA